MRRPKFGMKKKKSAFWTLKLLDILLRRRHGSNLIMAAKNKTAKTVTSKNHFKWNWHFN